MLLITIFTLCLLHQLLLFRILLFSIFTACLFQSNIIILNAGEAHLNPLHILSIIIFGKLLIDIFHVSIFPLSLFRKVDVSPPTFCTNWVFHQHCSRISCTSITIFAFIEQDYIIILMLGGHISQFYLYNPHRQSLIPHIITYPDQKELAPSMSIVRLFVYRSAPACEIEMQTGRAPTKADADIV